MGKLPFDVGTNPTWRNMQRVIYSYKQLARGARTLCMTCGGPGIGKTWELRAQCRLYGIRHVPDERPENAAALAQTMWLNRECEVISHNECDHLFDNQQSINLLKTAHEDPREVKLATKDAQRNQYFLEKGSAQYDPAIPPPRFPLGNMVRQAFICNENFTDPKVISKLPRADWLALVRRGIDPVFVPTEGRDGLDLFEYTIYKASEGKMLRSLQYSYEVSRQAINFFVRHADRLQDISPARLVMIADVLKNTPSHVQRELDLENMLATTPLRTKLTFEQPFVQVLLWPKERPTPWWEKRRQIAARRSRESRGAGPSIGPINLTPAPGPAAEPPPTATGDATDTAGPQGDAGTVADSKAIVHTPREVAVITPQGFAAGLKRAGAANLDPGTGLSLEDDHNDSGVERSRR